MKSCPRSCRRKLGIDNLFSEVGESLALSKGVFCPIYVIHHRRADERDVMGTSIAPVCDIRERDLITGREGVD